MIFIPGMRAAQRDTRIPPLILQAANNDLNNLSTYSANSVSFNVAAPDRQIFIGVMAQGANQALTSATIGGVAATILGQGQTAGGNVAIIGANVPTGTARGLAFSITAEQCSG